MAVNEIAVTVQTANVNVSVTPTPLEIANDVYVTVSSVSAIAVSVGQSNINVSAVRTGPPGNGLGMLLQDYAIQGQLPTWNGAVLVNLDNGNVVQATLAGDVTGMTVTGWPGSGTEGKLVMYIPQGATPYDVLAWPLGVKWMGGISPQLTTLNGHVDVVVLTSVDAGTNIYGFHVGTAA
jgi:hypothetical protein